MAGSEPHRIRVGVADMAVTDNGANLVTSGLGSCVAVGLHDQNGNGGLLHAMLPKAPTDAVDQAKYVDSGLEAMKDELSQLGANTRSLTAKIAGGSKMLDLGGDDPVGMKNVRAAEAALERAGIDVEGADTGGDTGRSVSFRPETGTMRIEQVDADPLKL